MIYLVLPGVLFIGIGFIFGVGLLAFWGYNVFLCICSVIDLCLLPKRGLLAVTRQLPEAVDVLQPFEVAINIRNESGQALSFSLTDDLPITFEPFKPLEDRLDGKIKTVFYKTAGKERGKYVFSYIYLRYWGLIKNFFIGQPSWRQENGDPSLAADCLTGNNTLVVVKKHVCIANPG